MKENDQKAQKIYFHHPFSMANFRSTSCFIQDPSNSDSHNNDHDDDDDGDDKLFYDMIDG